MEPYFICTWTLELSQNDLWFLAMTCTETLLTRLCVCVWLFIDLFLFNPVSELLRSSDLMTWFSPWYATVVQRWEVGRCVVFHGVDFFQRWSRWNEALSAIGQVSDCAITGILATDVWIAALNLQSKTWRFEHMLHIPLLQLQLIAASNV